MPGSEALLERSRAFYTAHGLTALAEALPAAADVALSEGALALVFPPVAVQQAALPELVERLASAPAEGLSADQQYGEAWVHDVDGLIAAQTRNRPDGAYVLALEDNPFPDETRNRTTPQLDKLFTERGWSNLTAAEYLVLQRLQAERHGDHRFDDYVGGDRPAGWMWLLDQRVPGQCVMAYWNPRAQRIELGRCRQGAKNARRGAYPTTVIPL